MANLGPVINALNKEGTTLDDVSFLAAAMIGTQRLSNRDILDDEFARARHALAYLKKRYREDAMRELLREDLLAMTACVLACLRRPEAHGKRARSK